MPKTFETKYYFFADASTVVEGVDTSFIVDEDGWGMMESSAGTFETFNKAFETCRRVVGENKEATGRFYIIEMEDGHHVFTYEFSPAVNGKMYGECWRTGSYGEST